MKKFLEDLRHELEKRKVDSKTIDEIIADHEEMIENAVEEGVSEEDLESKFGNPEQLAEEIFEDQACEGESEDERDKKLVLWQEFNPESNEIDIETSIVNDDIEIILADTDKIQVYWIKNHHQENYILTYDGKTLTLSDKRKNFRFYISNIRRNIKFRIVLPEGTMINDFNHHGTNSDVVCRNLKIDQFKINTTNGDFMIDNVTAGKTDWHSVNGDFKTRKSNFDSLVANMVSGDISMENTTVKNDLEIGTVSGDVNIRNSQARELDYHTVSGDFSGRNFMVDEVSLRSVSGDISIHNDDKRPIAIIKKKTVSGDISIN